MYSVYQHWDKLKTCVVGKTYTPEFYSFLKNAKLRNLFEKIAKETEEDLDNLEKLLQSFNVKTIRPNVPDIDALNYIKNGELIPPPVSMIPRDQMIIIGEKFFLFPFDKISLKTSAKRYQSNFENKFSPYVNLTENFVDWWNPITEIIKKEGNEIISKKHDKILINISANGITRVGKDLYIGTDERNKIITNGLRHICKKYFSHYRCHEVSTEGHIDGSFTPVIPGLIVSVEDINFYKNTFPNWEIVYLPHESYYKMKEWDILKHKNGGSWWIKGYEYDDDVYDFVETYLKKWVGYVEETVFDVNMLVVDKKNVIVSGYNKIVFDTFERYGVTPHICNLRHRYFWDGGIHCVTLDLDREGQMEDYFKERGEPSEYLSYLV